MELVPRLQTERLILRALRPEDFEEYARFMADPDVMRYLSGDPLSRADSWRSMAAVMGHWMLRGYGMWAVERKEDGAFVGRVGLHNPEGWPALEVGWTLGKDYWGKGYASEAAHTAMHYAFATQSVDRMISVIDPGNIASQKVAARLGETRGPRQEIPYNGKIFTADIWSITREAWRVQGG